MINYPHISYHTLVLPELPLHYQPIDNSFISGEEISLLMNICLKLSGNVLEIGTHSGKTTTNLARIVKDKGDKLITIDVTQPPRSLTGAQSAAECLPQALIGCDIPDEYRKTVDIKLINPNTPNALYDAIKDLNLKFDVIFVDGDHSFDGCWNDYNVTKSFLSSKGVMLFHDVWWDVEPPLVEGPLKVLNMLGGFILNKTHIGIPKIYLPRLQ